MTRNLTDKQLAVQVHIYVVYKDRVYGIYFLFNNSLQYILYVVFSLKLF